MNAEKTDAACLRKVLSRKIERENKKYIHIPAVRVKATELKPKSHMKSVLKPPPQTSPPTKPKPRQTKPRQPTKPKPRQSKPLQNPYYNTHLKFFTGFSSTQRTRKKFGAERILKELQRSMDDMLVYGGFFENRDNWVINPIQEMNLLKQGEQSFAFEPQCILGVGGQGCVFLGKIGVVSYAFKIRSRPPTVKRSGTSASPNRRKSPSFKMGDRGGIQETSGEERRKVVNFIDDAQQESLHREAVAAFRVYSATSMLPKPLIYGYTGNYTFEVFVMECMDYTLHDFISGTTWAGRMAVLDDIWPQLEASAKSCEQAGVVHFDIKPDNVAFKIEPGLVSMGLLDYGISKCNNYTLDRFLRGVKLFRPPGTVTFMPPRAHLWKPMSSIDDYMSLFFTMYVYGTAEGVDSHPSTARRFKYPLKLEDRKTLTPEEVAVFCLRNPPWARLPYGMTYTTKKQQNESIVKEEVSLGMLKIHSITSPKNVDDIIGIILNLDGFLDDTLDIQNVDDGEGFTAKTTEFMETFFNTHAVKFVEWWLAYAKTCMEIIDTLHEKTPEERRNENRDTFKELLRKNVQDPGEISGLVEDSSYGLKIVEMDAV